MQVLFEKFDGLHGSEPPSRLAWRRWRLGWLGQRGCISGLWIGGRGRAGSGRRGCWRRCPGDGCRRCAGFCGESRGALGPLGLGYG